MEHRNGLKKFLIFFRGALGVCFVVVVFQIMTVSRTVNDALVCPVLTAEQRYLKGEQGHSSADEYVAEGYNVYTAQGTAGGALTRNSSTEGVARKQLEPVVSPISVTKPAAKRIKHVSAASKHSVREKERLRRFRAVLFWAYAARYPKAAASRILLADDSPVFTLSYDKN